MSDTYLDHCDICHRGMEWARLKGSTFICPGCGTTTSERTLQTDTDRDD